jgi:hypothetical protein
MTGQAPYSAPPALVHGVPSGPQFPTSLQQSPR